MQRGKYFTRNFIERKLSSVLLQSATIAGADAPIVETAFLYGKNLGLAFQFVDDLLDFVSSSETMGKPAAADLKLGLATAPVLFACEKVQTSHSPNKARIMFL